MSQNHLFVSFSPTVLVHTKAITRWPVVGIHHATLQLGKYPPPATFILANGS